MPRKTQAPPRVVVFAGPNGAGKSTHADAILAALGMETFVNADYIARGLSGRHTDGVAFEAGRIMLRRLHQLGDAGADFAFESTLASRSFAPFLRQLKAQGYIVAIYYFSLANAQLAIRRVKLRVALGGHDVPGDVVRRRFGRSLNNFLDLYVPLADEWTLFDNSTSPHARTVAAKLANQLTVTETATWHKLQKLSIVV
ncbi:MAG: AAA family ATPase [Gammaproteobacteria bacterium]|uniref:zeta toxin family protein n=1 Tax=Rhodoferax sp. TaxID=50421 RepID=UPI00183EB296|nr:AAA family ATPase [Rhodoferax sp.]MBU3899932.1 AAA family ATPase [Gammaproteobacteria bacterium]MBA3057316.1 AAA family ATPase [Rhodoferax sp.]MBU3996004.1 AAA family ATPase [Gammaproteobacteria bacterium]MBU4019198.1 AAA family ATPase [Gammaproteobacteria bacterium]MBU4078916.1 AAA family ATPase [Gammaproteobacteria bacterium]